MHRARFHSPSEIRWPTRSSCWRWLPVGVVGSAVLAFACHSQSETPTSASAQGGTTQGGASASGSAGTASGGVVATGGTQTALGGQSQIGSTAATGGFPALTGGTQGISGQAGAGTGGATSIGGTTSDGSEDNLPQPVAKAGFIEIEAVSYSYTTGVNPSPTHQHASSSPAKLFYSFIPADSQPKSAPIFVFFNGGPAWATTTILHAYGTGPYTLADPSVAALRPQPNPSSWTSLGNLLYLDSRQAGFSYSTLPNPESADARRAELSQSNFNVYVDAADFVRVLLRTLKSMPALRNNPVVLVGESYGGTRAANMLRMLLDPSLVAAYDRDYYGDPALWAEILAHYAAAFPGEDASQIRGASAARQFGWQVLLQPDIAYTFQLGVSRCSTAYSLARRVQELGLSCPPSDRDQYDWSKPNGWSSDFEEQARQVIASADGFAQIVGVPASSVSGLSAAERVGAYRIFVGSTAPTDPTGWVAQFGPLADFDRYLVASNTEVSTFYSPLISDSRTYADGLFFLQNLRYVHTFITRAALDSVIVSDAIPELLGKYSTLMSPPIVTGVTLDVAPRSGVERPGWITVTYSGTLQDTAVGSTRSIRFPTYSDSGHMLTISSPSELYSDVRAFMHETLP
jgi:hypothetical protein